jgi:hypothetical protein
VNDQEYLPQRPAGRRQSQQSSFKSPLDSRPSTLPTLRSRSRDLWPICSHPCRFAQFSRRAGITKAHLKALTSFRDGAQRTEAIMRDLRRSNNSLFADRVQRRRELSLRQRATSLRFGERPCCVDRQPEEESESEVHCCRRFHLAWPAWRNCDGNEASSARAKGAKSSFDFSIVRLKLPICALCRSSHPLALDLTYQSRTIDLRPTRLNRFVGRAREDQGAQHISSGTRRSSKRCRLRGTKGTAYTCSG